MFIIVSSPITGNKMCVNTSKILYVNEKDNNESTIHLTNNISLAASESFEQVQGRIRNTI